MVSLFSLLPSFWKIRPKTFRVEDTSLPLSASDGTPPKTRALLPLQVFTETFSLELISLFFSSGTDFHLYPGFFRLRPLRHHDVCKACVCILFGPLPRAA